MKPAGPHPDDDDRYAYNTEALARLALSDEMCELADAATSLVSTTDDAGWRGGELVEAARSLVGLAQMALTRAVIYEREQGTSWETIGEAIDITRQSAHARYRDDEQEWKDALLEPFSDPGARIRNLRLPEAAYRPTEAGKRLDEWGRKHLHQAGETPVTGGLPELDVINEMNQVLAGLNHLYKPVAGWTDEEQQERRARLFDRKAALLDRIATEINRPEAAQQAEEARVLAAEIRRGRGAGDLRVAADE